MYGITECVDGYYCNTCGRHVEDKHPEKCERPLSEVDIYWDAAVRTLEEAAKMYADSKTGDRLFTFNPEAIRRVAAKISRFRSEGPQRWQLDAMRDRMKRT